MRLSYLYFHHFSENEGIESKILVEGDMRLTKKQVYNIEHGLDVDSSRKRGSIADNSLWPNGLVPYEIHPSISKFIVSLKFSVMDSL